MASGKHTHIDFNVDEDEEGDEEIRKQFYDKFNQQNGLLKQADSQQQHYDEEEYEYEEE